MGDFDLGKVLTQAMQLEHMKRQRAAAPLDSAQSMMQYLQHDPNAQFTPALQNAFSGMAGGVPFDQIQGGISPIVKQARQNELRKEMRKMRQGFRSQAANNELILGTLLPESMDPTQRNASMSKLRSMQALRAQEDLRDMLNEYPDMANDPMGQQLIKEFIDSFRIESGGLDLSSVINMAPQKQQPMR